jgi:WD40 repeat protein
LGNKNSITEYEGHQSYINSISFDHEGCVLASVSDDLTCRVWNIKEGDERRKLEFKINRSSPGMYALNYIIIGRLKKVNSNKNLASELNLT